MKFAQIEEEDRIKNSSRVYFVYAKKSPFFPDIFYPDPQGLAAIGGRLNTAILLEAYTKGLFPWYEKDPPLWFCPNPRLVLFPENHHLSRRLKREWKKINIELAMDLHFDEVIQACAQQSRREKQGTWINAQMLKAYKELYREGYAHSVEVYQGGKLVGGLYGLSLGRAFFGESMFSKIPGASKLALYALVRWCLAHRYHFIDCQATTGYLLQFGAKEISRPVFLDYLQQALKQKTTLGPYDLKEVSLPDLHGEVRR